MNLLQILESVGIKLSFLIPGFFSGIISAYVDGKKGILNYSFCAFIGSMTTNYFSPVAIKYFTLNNEYYFGISFFIGLVSMNLTILIIAATKNITSIKEFLKNIYK